MSILKQLDFLKDINNSIEEDFSIYIEKYKVSKIELQNIYTKANLISIFNVRKNNDNIHIFIDDEYNETKVDFTNLESINNKFNILDFENIDDEACFIIRIELTKSLENTLNIYSFQTFLNWLTTNDNVNSFFSKLQVLNPLSKNIYFHILDEENIYFYSNKFIFYSELQSHDENNILYIDKNKLIDRQKEHCHFSDMSTINFIPNDFKLIIPSTYQDINKLFNEICFLLTLTFIADISEIQQDNSNEIFYKIHGYKSINNTIKFDNISVSSLDEYYKIYNWIYINDTNSSIADKLGIARNLITLHLQDNDFSKLDDNTYHSIESNYKIYLKENVQQYLEVKSQVSSFIYDMSMKAENYTHTFMDTFKTNFLIFISYFISIIVVTAIDKGKFINVFSTEVSVITLMMLTISWKYKNLTIYDINTKIERFKIKYELLKKRYNDILEPDNLKELFADDKEYDNDVTYMTETLAKFTSLWETTIISFFIITLGFCILHDTNNLIEFLVSLYMIIFTW